MSTEQCISVFRGVNILLYLNGLHVKQVYKSRHSDIAITPLFNICCEWHAVRVILPLCSYITLNVIQVLGRSRDCGVIFKSGAETCPAQPVSAGTFS